MKESFRRKKKEIERKLSERNCEHGADGNAIVNMTVKDDSNFLSVFSSGQAPVISTEVADFIENNTHTIRSNEELTLRIYGNCIDEQEKVTYGSAIKEYYAEKYLANEIIAWVFLWEAVDIAVFENRSLRLKRLRYISYMSMKIEYYPLMTDEHNQISDDLLEYAGEINKRR